MMMMMIMGTITMIIDNIYEQKWPSTECIIINSTHKKTIFPELRLQKFHRFFGLSYKQATLLRKYLPPSLSLCIYKYPITINVIFTAICGGKWE